MAEGIMGATGSAAAGAAAATAAQQRADEIGDRFLTLLVAQMKNQSPLDPMDSSQFTSQVAQINTVSGINKLNETLASITGQIDNSQRLQANALIGRNVMVDGDTIKVGEAGAATAFGMDLEAPARHVTVTITDKAGTLISKQTLDNVSAGIQSFAWDGRDSGDQVVDEGVYKLHIEAVDAHGDDIKVQPLMMGHVSSVVLSGSKPQLDLGPGGLVALDDVQQILGPFDVPDTGATGDGDSGDDSNNGDGEQA